MISFVKGADVSMIVRLSSGPVGAQDPLDLTNASSLRACFLKSDGTSLYAWYLKKTGTTSSGLDIVTGIDTTDILEGMPIVGAGIPLNTTVLKTPASLTSPTAAGTIKISANATGTATVSLSVGNIFMVSAVIGKIRIVLNESETSSLESGSAQNFELRIIIADYTSYAQFPASLEIKEPYC